MDFSLTDEQKALRDSIVRFARAELNPGVIERDRAGRFPRELWRQCGDMGLLGQPAHPDVRAAVSAAIRRIRATGRFAGVLTPVEDFAKACLADGAVFVSVGNDLSLLARQSEALRKRFD